MSKANEDKNTDAASIQKEIEQLRALNSGVKEKIDIIKTRSEIIDKDFVLKLENDIVAHFRAEKDVKDLMNLKASIGELYESDITTRYANLLKQREQLYLRILQIPTNEFYYEYLDVLFLKEKKTVNVVKLIENKPKPKIEPPKDEPRLVKTEKVKNEPKGQFFILPEFFKKNSLSAMHKSIKTIKNSRAQISNLCPENKPGGKFIQALKENKSIKVNEGNVAKAANKGKTTKKVTFKINTRSDAKLPVRNWRPKPKPEKTLIKVKSSGMMYKNGSIDNRAHQYGRTGQVNNLGPGNVKRNKFVY